MDASPRNSSSTCGLVNQRVDGLRRPLRPTYRPANEGESGHYLISREVEKRFAIYNAPMLYTKAFAVRFTSCPPTLQTSAYKELDVSELVINKTYLLDFLAFGFSYSRKREGTLLFNLPIRADEERKMKRIPGSHSINLTRAVDVMQECINETRGLLPDDRGREPRYNTIALRPPTPGYGNLLFWKMQLVPLEQLEDGCQES